MSNQDYRPQGTAGKRPEQLGAKKESSTSRIAKSALSQAQEAGSEAASTITGHVKALLDEKVSDGADIVGHLASSAQCAAEDLDQNSPQLAGLVRGMADRLAAAPTASPT